MDECFDSRIENEIRHIGLDSIILQRQQLPHPL